MLTTDAAGNWFVWLASLSSGGTVTSITAGANLDGGVITVSGTVSWAYRLQTKATNYTVNNTDSPTMIVATAAITLTLPLTTSLTLGNQFMLFVNAQLGDVTFTPDSSEVIVDGLLNLPAGAPVTLREGCWTLVTTDGAGRWYLDTARYGRINCSPD